VSRLKEEEYKTNPHALEELSNNIRSDISAISGEELRRVNNFLRSFTECIRSGKPDFNTYCSTGGFLLDFLKVIITVNLLLASLTDISPEILHMTTLEERWSGAYRPGRETHRIQ
jgi:hypothetical protein